MEVIDTRRLTLFCGYPRPTLFSLIYHQLICVLSQILTVGSMKNIRKKTVGIVDFYLFSFSDILFFDLRENCACGLRKGKELLYTKYCLAVSE